MIRWHETPRGTSPYQDRALAVFHHCRLSGGDPPIDFNHALGIYVEQMLALKDSGLEDAADFIYCGVNGGPADFAAAACLAPERAEVVEHPATARSELSTMRALQQWLPGHENWFVLFHHLKCATRKDEWCAKWRLRMQDAVVTNWRRCVADLEAGSEAVGCHWLTPEQFRGLVRTPYFAGTFWFAKASYLITLPPLPKATWENRFEAEIWIGKGPRRPVVKCYREGWPM